MNRVAFEAIIRQQRLYLLANGWTEIADDEWQEPEGYRGHRRQRVITFGHAVNSQLYSDRTYREPPPPETPEQRHERWIGQLRAYFADRHVGKFRQLVRGHIRWIARELGEEGAVTRVQKARLRRALHAKHHKNKGCECGKEGAPY